MNDLGLISTQLWALLRCGAVPDERVAGGALRCPVDDRRCIQLRFQPAPPRWLLGVEQATDMLSEDSQARCLEALLRTAHASRWTEQLVGALDADGCLSLVDCDFPGTLRQAAALAGAAAIEGRLAALLHQLDGLASRDADVATAAVATAAAGTHSWLKA